MGNCFGFRRRGLRRHIVLILIGLDNAGKTKTINNLAGEKDDKVLPTVGFKAVNLIHKDTPVTIYDLGGGPHFRQIWPQYYSEVHGVIFVIDSSDFTRLDECKAVLEEVLSHDKISGKPVLVLANKQDKAGALDDIDVVEKLNVEPLVNRYRCPTLVESYSARPDSTTKKPKIDPGLRKGYHWLLNYIVKRYGDINLRVQTDIHAELERRKRMLNRASNRASQTFTANSDDIATQTGFENPNYDMNKSTKSCENETKNLDRGLIHVKPIKKPNSLDSTITVESVDDSDRTSDAKPKLSPLFGRLSHSKNTSIEEEPKDATYVGDGTRTLDPAVDFKHRVLVSDAELALMHREIVLTERAEHTSKATSSDIVPGATTLPLSVRPASASQLLRRQLEICPAHHKRRLSLRYMQRNKTSPERNTMLMYEPKAQRHLDKGDFEQSTAIN
ncbi:uncharacterized protein LOC120634878 isoform X3 [Pararge aegeria]|uniref:uncharacterized protein LOC120634878 isoform X3 n=1 Tax=Pararge aegeria TaxID=116150 RepID=UPI0019CFC0AA|nr:uncharacterized protein LOC120634878 isoform X3 [Pararge aegeria]